MKKFLLPAISKAINAYIALDPESRLRLKKLHGKTVIVELLPFHFTFQCLFSETGITIQNDAGLPADTNICGTPLQMLGMMVDKENRQRFFAEDVKIEGSAELGLEVIELFDELQIDWEEYLSHLTGDVPAYYIGRISQGISAWLQNAEKKVTQNINEYVHEETLYFPPREALQDFFNDIDRLRMDTDRIAAKIARLELTIEEA